MQRWRRFEDVPADWGPSVVAIGVFDGVHRGHRSIVGRAVAAAAELCAQPVVVTFDPHPMAVLRPEAAPLLLGSIDERLDLLAGLGVAGVLVLPFGRSMSEWPPEEFVRRVVVDAVHARRVVVGENFRFGHRAAGDVTTLAALGEQAGFDVDAVGLIGGDEPVSSTLVRGLIAAGDVTAAAAALERPFRVVGRVVRGDGRGRGLGFPTANVEVPDTLAVPGDGVYAGWLVRRDGGRLPAAISVGTNPTFDGTERRVEAYVLDADLDLYGERVAIEFVARVRGQVRFDSVDDLIERMAQDIAEIRQLLPVGAAPPTR